MPAERSIVASCVSVLAALCLVILVFLFAQLGGLLNRGRGGYVNFGEVVDYWSAHVLSRLLFAVPTGLVVLLFGLHIRASLVVFFLTWFSLYTGWGAYFNIGLGDSGEYLSRSGVFDWLLGRQDDPDWSFHRRFAREYAGMSLRGLLWTAPQGYALQQLGFGWEYGLSGSLMALVYYSGAKTPPDGVVDGNLEGSIPSAEWYWGWWMWFVLIISCLSQLVRRIHVWLYTKNPYQVEFKPFSAWEIIKYESLNRQVIRIAYEVFIFVLNIIFSCSVMYYSLVMQTDIRNKGQSMFGLFTGVLFLTATQSWVMSLTHLNRQLKNVANTTNQRRHRFHPSSPRTSPRTTNDIEHLEAAATATNGETQPLLSWPYGNDDRAPPPERLNLPEGGHTTVNREVYHAQLAPANTSAAFLILWTKIETWVWFDIFIWMRRLIGLVSLVSTIVTILLTVIATLRDLESPRYSYVYDVMNTSNDTVY